MNKLIIFLIIVLFNFNTSISQEVDVSVTGSWSPNPIQVGESSELTLSVQNNSFITIPAGFFTVDIKFNVGYEGSLSNPPTGANSGNFDWYFFPVGNPFYPNGGWYGINNVGLGFSFNEVVLHVIGTSVVQNSTTQVQVSVQSPYFDVINNNSLVAPLSVNAQLPIELMSFDAKSNECGKVEITWATASEQNNDYMELLRSTDGKEYISLTKVKGTNTKSVTEYSFVDTQNLINGETYYYRLRQVDFDGRSEMLKVSSITMRCPNEALSMDIYPNPVLQKLNVEFSGATTLGKTKIAITNTAGELVRTYDVLTTEINEIDLTGLTSGVYQLRTTDLSETLTKRFVKID